MAELEELILGVLVNVMFAFFIRVPTHCPLPLYVFFANVFLIFLGPFLSVFLLFLRLLLLLLFFLGVPPHLCVYVRKLQIPMRDSIHQLNFACFSRLVLTLCWNVSFPNLLHGIHQSHPLHLISSACGRCCCNCGLWCGACCLYCRVCSL